MIVEHSCWAGSPLDFNDPFDCLPYIDSRATEVQKRRWAQGYVDKRFPKANRTERKRRANDVLRELKCNFAKLAPSDAGHEAWRMALSRSGVLSFACSPNDILMWGYYADSHRGYCLEFKTNCPPLINALEVTYDVERPVFRPFGSRDIDNVMISTLLQKAKCWEHENEYRIIRPGEVGVMKLAGDALKSIILGAAIKKEDEDALRRMAAERANPVKFKRTALDRKTYQMSIIDA